MRREQAMDAPAKKSKLIKGATGDWEVVIGMEVHAQVSSRAKLFSGASTAFGGGPNAHVSLVDAAMPGMLPVINEECVRQAVRTGLGLKAKINLKSVFDRKNYFYPDLPQGYQISQYKSPIVGEGEVVVDLPDGEAVKVGIERLHLEQDAGKLLHDQRVGNSFVDLNRSGVALMEIVTKPDLRSADEATAFLRKLQSIMRYLGTCDGEMHKGNLRADVNISVRRPGEPLFATRCEVKNLNSFRFIAQAIEYEARRQIDTIEDGGKIRQETRLFDPRKRETRSMRSKEEAHDYRYFPDPDLLPLEVSRPLVDELQRGLAELPDEKKARYVRDYGLTASDAGRLTAEKETATYYERMLMRGAEPKAAANWLVNEYLGRLGKQEETEDAEVGAAGMGWHQSWDEPMSPPRLIPQSETVAPVGPPSNLTPSVGANVNITMGPFEPQIELRLGPLPASANVTIVVMVSSGDISSKTAKEVLDYVMEHPDVDPKAYVEQHKLRQVTDVSAIEALVDEIIAKNPDKIADAKKNPKAIGWFVGQVMKSSGGKANPQAVNDLLRRKLGI
jgi:aspartyl-tRNA(Asn)/glutamyl-tRNA(Gln) amidotransferase subunit B